MNGCGDVRVEKTSNPVPVLPSLKKKNFALKKVFHCYVNVNNTHVLHEFPNLTMVMLLHFNRTYNILMHINMCYR